MALGHRGPSFPPQPWGVHETGSTPGGRFLARLQQAFDRGELYLTGGLAPLGEPAAFTAWVADLRRQAWVVYSQPPFAGPEHVLAYLGRYTHRIALSNDRLLAVRDGRVRFRWRDYADGAASR